MNMNCMSLPFGIDTDFIEKRNKDNIKDEILIYYKNRHKDDLNYVVNILNKYNIKYSVVKYGSYNYSEYLKKLETVKFVIWVGCHESQGFALEECLTRNVPILLWDVSSMYEEYNNGYIYNHLKQYNKKLIATSAPYWSDDCGIKFYNKDEFESVLNKMLFSYLDFEPRKYVEKVLDYKIVINNVINYIMNTHNI
jgi:hypothetical protein